MSSALFHEEAGRFIPSELTRGGWSDHAQHGSPPAGLLARAIEGVETAVPMLVTRLTVDLFRPVPLSPLSIEVDTLRDGKRIQVVEARMWADGIQVGHASALRIRTTDLDDADDLADTYEREGMPESAPEALPVLDWRDTFGRGGDHVRFHTDGVEIRTVDGSFLHPVPGRSWFRLRCRLMAGEELTPFQRVATMSDLANGNAQRLDPQRWLFVNPDITLYLHRLPEGEWIAMRSHAQQAPSGVGMTDTIVYDRQGRVGRILQSQLLEHR